MGIETLGHGTNQIEKSDYSPELFESLSRKGESRRDLLNLIIRYIKVKDYTFNNVNEMISKNYDRNNLHESIKDTAGKKLGRKWWKNIKNGQDLKRIFFPFELTDKQFCVFLLLSDEGKYDLEGIEISFGPKYDDLVQKKNNLEIKIEEQRKELEQQYQSEVSGTNVLEHRRLPEDCQYNVEQDEKEKFINNGLADLNKEKNDIENEIIKEESKFYAEYPYLKPEML